MTITDYPHFAVVAETCDHDEHGSHIQRGELAICRDYKLADAILNNIADEWHGDRVYIEARNGAFLPDWPEADAEIPF